MAYKIVMKKITDVNHPDTPKWEIWREYDDGHEVFVGDERIIEEAIISTQSEQKIYCPKCTGEVVQTESRYGYLEVVEGKVIFRKPKRYCCANCRCCFVIEKVGF